MVKAVSNRIARDRSAAMALALIAALPPAAAALGMLHVGYRILADPEVMNASAIWLLLAVVAPFALLFSIVARWTYEAVRATLTPQRVQAVWLRRSQSESGDAFRTSRIIDGLSRYGVAALTLQDRDIQLSFAQRHDRLALLFWILLIPLVLVPAYVLWQAAIPLAPPGSDPQSGGQLFGAVSAPIFVAIAVVFGITAALLAVMLTAGIMGPIGALLSGDRDDCAQLPQLLERIKRGKGQRGGAIVRVSDGQWREAVCASLAAVDVAIIDVSEMSEHVAWEIGEAAKACGAAALVFISREDDYTDRSKAAVQAALGRAPRYIVTYPNSRSSDAEPFTRLLRQHIYEAADMRHALNV
ncbi:MAG: hypothetical protein ACREH4_11935 [Vitreimonas sp.]